ncbi:MAG: hypothetical protein AAFY71_02450 [Bacteroidota bacterium]
MVRTILSLLFILLGIGISTTRAQQAYTLHPMIGPEITYQEGIRYQLFRKYPINVNRGDVFYLHKLPNGEYELKSRQDPTFKVGMKQNMIDAWEELVEENTQKIREALVLVKEELKERETVVALVKVYEQGTSKVLIYEVQEEAIIMGKENGFKLNVPRENIRSITVLGENGLKVKADAAVYTGYQAATGRLIFSRSAIPMEKGRLAYQNLILDGQKFTYGITDNISAFAGIDLIGSLSSLGAGSYRGLFVAGASYSRSTSDKMYVGLEATHVIVGSRAIGLNTLLVVTRLFNEGKLQISLKAGGSFFSFPASFFPAAPMGSLAWNYDLGDKWAFLGETYFIYNEEERDQIFNDQRIFARDLFTAGGIGFRRKMGPHAFDFGNVLAISRLTDQTTDLNRNELFIRTNSALNFISPFVTYTYLFPRRK